VVWNAGEGETLRCAAGLLFFNPPCMNSSASPLGPQSLPKGLVDEVKAVLLRRDGAAMLRVAKNATYFNYAIAMYVLVQAASVFSSWMMLRKTVSYIPGFDVGVDPTSLVITGAIGIPIGLAAMALLYIFAQKIFKAKPAVTLKEFITISCVITFPMVLAVIPSIGMLVGAIWAIVLFFAMMKHMMGFGIGKALLTAILAGIVVGIVQTILYSSLGLGGGDYSFQFNYGS